MRDRSSGASNASRGGAVRSSSSSSSSSGKSSLSQGRSFSLFDTSSPFFITATAALLLMSIVALAALPDLASAQVHLSPPKAEGGRFPASSSASSSSSSASTSASASGKDGDDELFQAIRNSKASDLDLDALEEAAGDDDGDSDDVEIDYDSEDAKQLRAIKKLLEKNGKLVDLSDPEKRKERLRLQRLGTNEILPRPKADENDETGGFAPDSDERKTFLEIERGFRTHDLLQKPVAYYNMALLYFHGYGTKINRQKAVELYTVAAELNMTLAMNDLAWCYANGIGTPRDDAKALFWYRKAAEEGLSTARSNLGFCYLRGGCSLAASNATEALKWLWLAGRQGEPNAQGHAGSLLVDKGKHMRTAAARKHMADITREFMDKERAKRAAAAASTSSKSAKAAGSRYRANVEEGSDDSWEGASSDTLGRRDGGHESGEEEASSEIVFRPTHAHVAELERRLGDTGLAEISEGLTFLIHAADEKDGDAIGGLPFAQSLLARFHLEHDAVIDAVLEKNATRARQLLELAARTNDTAAVNQLGPLFLHGLRIVQPSRPKLPFRQPSGKPFAKFIEDPEAEAMEQLYRRQEEEEARAEEEKKQQKEQAKGEPAKSRASERRKHAKQTKGGPGRNSTKDGKAKSTPELPPVSEKDKVVPRNPEKALHWFEVAAELGDTASLYEMALLYELGSARYIALSDEETAQYREYRKQEAPEADDDWEDPTPIPVEPHRPVARDPKKALALYLRGAEKEHIPSIEKVIECYQNAIGTVKSLSKVKHWNEKLTKLQERFDRQREEEDKRVAGSSVRESRPFV